MEVEAMVAAVVMVDMEITCLSIEQSTSCSAIDSELE